jgi:PAS domain S-box-containing protein
MAVRDSARRAQRERELEDRFRAVYQNAIDGIILMDDDLRIVDANPAACRLLGHSREQVIGARSIDFMPAEERGAADQMGEFRSVGVVAGEGPLVRGDGTIRRAEFGAVANVSPGIHLSIFRDIEDRKRAEESQRFLDEAAAALGTSLDYDETLARVAELAVPRMADWAAIDLVEDDGSFRRVAVAHVDPAKIALAHELRARQRPSIADGGGLGVVVRTGKPELIEVVTDEMLVAALGHTPDLLELIRGLGLVSAMTVPLSARGKVIGAVSFVSAESRRRYGPTDLAFAQELSRRAGHAVENALYVRDLELANRMKDLVLRRAQHLQATATRLVRAANVEAIAAAFEAGELGSPIVARGWSLFSRSGAMLQLVAATSEAQPVAQSWSATPLSAETPLTEAARTGRAIWLENREQFLARYPGLRGDALGDVEARAAIPLCTGDESMGVMGVMFDRPRVFDIEEREYLTAVANLWAQALHRAQLVEAEREAIRRALEAETVATRKKDEFLAMLGHELRNPLAPIVTATSLLRVRGRATNRELEILDRQARHMVRLIDDLLDISRITSGKLALKRGRVQIAEVVAQAIESTNPIFEERRLRLFSELPLTPMFVDGDRERLVQIMGNILVNAAKFTPAGKAVYVSGGAQNGDGLIVVRDEGRGIEPDLLPQVFDLFSQGRQGSDRANGGLGLGLAIARSIALAHGGHIEVASPGVDRGTTVTLRLPLAEAVRTDGVATAVARAESTTVTPGRHRVLIVDDNEDSALMLAEFLGEMGYECFVALDAARALALSREVMPDAAILDIGLPDVDGHELAREIRTALAERAPKLIALTGYARDSDRERAMEAGFAEHLAKPVEMAMLTAKLSGLLASGGGHPAAPAR